MQIFIKIFLFFLFSTNVFAQGVCDITTAEKGNFTFVSSSAICSGSSVTIQDNSGGTNVQYIYGYQGEDVSQLANLSPSSSLTSQPFITSQNHSFVILQYGTKGGKPMYYCSSFTVLANKNPVFTNSTCNDNFISVTIPIDPLNIFTSYTVDWKDGSPIQTITTIPATLYHSFSTAVTTLYREIDIRGVMAGGLSCSATTPTRVLLDNTEFYPAIQTLELTTDSKAILTFTGAKDKYDIYQRSATGNYTNGVYIAQELPGTYTFDLIDLNQSCFKVWRNFGCKEGSGEVCTTKLDVKAVDKTNVLTWQAHPTGKTSATIDLTVEVTGVNTIIPREEIGGANTNIIYPGNPHIDPIDCSKKYCYQVQNTVIGTTNDRKLPYQSLSLSPKICVDRATVHPDALTKTIVSVNDFNKSEITFTDDSPWSLIRKQYNLYNWDGTTANQINKSPTNVGFIDNIVDNSQKSTCYKISFIDECNSESVLLPPFCTTYLHKNAASNLEWTSESPFGGSAVQNYEVQVYDETTHIPSTQNYQTTTTYTPVLTNFQEEAKYRIKIIASDGSISYSNTYTIPIKVTLFIPNAFTPNHDGVNDEIALKGSLSRIIDFEMIIYNRWGNAILKTTEPTKIWDGMLQNGEIAPTDTYAYTLRAKLSDGQEINKTGKFSLLR
jgi:gliding motility-associated-like protein